MVTHLLFKMNTNISSLSDYRAAACILNNTLRSVQAKIVNLKHQNQMLRDRLAQKKQEIIMVRQGHAFADSCNRTLRSYFGDISKQQEQIMDLLKKSSKPTPCGIITIDDPSLATKIRRTRTNIIGKQLLRTSSSPGMISSITDGSIIEETSPGPARGVTYSEPPVLVPQATISRHTPGHRPEGFENNSVIRRKLTSSEMPFVCLNDKDKQLAENAKKQCEPS